MTVGGRDRALDQAKGLAILLVVLGHVLRGLMSAGLLTAPWWSVLDYAIYTIHIPALFFIAGTLAHGRARLPAGPFLRRIGGRYLYPFYLWSAIQGALWVVMSRFTNNPSTWERFLEFPWNPMPPYWFLLSLALCHLYFRHGERFPWAALGLAGLGYVVSGLHYDQLNEMRLHMTIGETFRGLVFFLAGVLWRRFDLPLLAGPRIVVVLAAGFALLAPLCLKLEIPIFFALPASLAGIALVLAGAPRLPGPEWLAALGRWSMPVFLLHMMCTAGTRIALHRLGGIDAASIHLVAGMAAGVLIPLAVFAAARRLRLDGWLGLSGGQRA